MLWLAAYLPRFPLEASVNLPSVDDVPLAIVTPGPQREVVCCNSPAADCGIHPGMPLAMAQSLFPHLSWHEHQPQQTWLSLQRLGLWALQFTPSVSLEAASGLLLEVGGCMAYFGGLAPLLSQLQQGLQQQGFNAQLAAAPFAAAAMLLARSAPGMMIADRKELASHLDILPLGCLGQEQRATNWLCQLGITTLGACRRLPRAGLARRLGKELLLQLDRVYGDIPDPRVFVQPPVSFSQQLELAFPVEHAEALVFAAKRLCDAAAGFLANHGSGARRLQFDLLQRQAQMQQINIGMARASRNADLFLSLLREHLQQLQLQLPVEHLRLSIPEREALPGSDQALQGLNSDVQPTNEQAWDELQARLQARLGREALRFPFCVEEWRPELAMAWQHEPVEARVAATSGNGALLRPLWLLPQPLQLEEQQEHPWLNAPLKLTGNTERIETGWWDTQPVRRDYYLAQSPLDGVRYWIFRAHDSRAWFLHGVFG